MLGYQSLFNDDQLLKPLHMDEFQRLPGGFPDPTQPRCRPCVAAPVSQSALGCPATASPEPVALAKAGTYMENHISMIISSKDM